ncbi:nucleotidyltransferase domain-containing protein [Fredinandcohnia sp. QZ13]|uniref:nucleotidyltransferase domain-containing protein n=1 Tax=Fredinandcohnia sp. QZ13 TaxID=3073144 RepID=UPI0028536E22|nr:nucleotidyltransferase domain-containing protein [Fredinandcohnia sp. QZ13]MDR4886137.1 nucleotidyltransferase domain-containing protein [Fredinandcohnia sp. QZ13]
MTAINKMKPIKAAQQFIQKWFPDCQAALLAGSVTRGDATETSDLDIIVFQRNILSSYRESLFDFGWPIEVFVHNETSYKQFFETDKKRARPSMPRMVYEGIILKNNGLIEGIKKEAKELLDIGPDEWTKETVDLKRYFITDTLDDFMGCENREEVIFIASSLAELTSEFVLRINRKWIGASKWVYRSLKDFDQEFANRFVDAFDLFYKSGDKSKVVQLVNDVLEPYGGRLFEGFSLGKIRSGGKSNDK